MKKSFNINLQNMKKQTLKTPDKISKKKAANLSQTVVKNNTGTRPEKDTNPLPPNPNQVDNHETK